MDLLREKLRAQGHHCPGVAAAMIGSAVVGGAVSASSSKSAANKQAASANNATQAQLGMFNRTVELNNPYNQSGVAATAKLNTLLGTNGGNSIAPGASYVPDESDPVWQGIVNKYRAWHTAKFGTAPTTDYNAGPDERQLYQNLLSEYHAAKGDTQPQAQAQNDPAFGSLLKPFSMDDFQLDPGIQFQTQQGNQALMNSQAAKNGVLSGGALKDLIAYNQGMAGTGYQSAFDRYMANKSFTLGSLMDMSKLGQSAASGTASAAPSFSSGIAGSMMGAGNAQAAGSVGAGNALSGAASGVGNSYFLSSLLSKNGSAGGTPAGGVVSDDSIANFA